MPIYQILGVTPPKKVNGVDQIKFDGTGLAYTFTDGNGRPQKKEQFFDNNGSRAIYKDGWIACTFGPLIPWDTAGSVSRIAKWDSATDKWELYHVAEDFSEANDLANKMSDRLAEMKKEFLALAADNKDFPIGAGNWLRLHPEDRIKSAYTSWTFTQDTRRMPEFAAPGLGRESNRVEMEVEVPDNANGVLYALGGAGGGLTVYMDKGHLVYLYNMMIIEQYNAQSAEPIPPGKHKVEIVTEIAGPGKPGTATLLVDGREVGKAELKRTVPAAFSATETFDVGADLGSTVSLDYYDRRPFEFNGKIENVAVQLTKP
jgi:hypothetical protein